MTGMLASVNSQQEALFVLKAKVDIIDLKQPEQGALGALDVEEVKKIVHVINQQCLVSATVGDLPMQADVVFQAVKAMSKTGVDYVKIGFFPKGDTLATVQKLAQLTQQGISLIAVLFADAQPDLSIIPLLKTTSFKGVMLDTMDKQRGSLTDVMNFETLEKFIKLSKQHHLLCGLAGSLAITDIDSLLTLKPDYLGFRGALCQQQNRVAALNNQAIIEIQKKFL